MDSQSPLATSLVAVTAALTALYANAQLVMFGRFGRMIARYKGGDLLRVQLRRVAQSEVAQVNAQTPPLVEQLVTMALSDGAKTGGPSSPVGSFGIAGDTPESHAERSARAIREDLQGKLNALGYRITRYADDVYQAVTSDAAIDQVLGLTPAQAQHQAYMRLLEKGIDGFTDSRGRNWELNAYVDAAVRSAAQRAFNVSLLDRMLSNGVTYFTVSDDGAPCPLCEPWEGVILTNGIPDEIAAHTIEEATAAGLFHVRCRHVLIGFFPGVSKIPEPHPWGPEDQKRYDDSQRQRLLERNIRAAKRQLAGAYTPEMKALANRRVRDAQQRMRDFIAQTGLNRIPRREQLHL